MTRPSPGELAAAAVDHARQARASVTTDPGLKHLAQAIEYLALAFGDFASQHASDFQDREEGWAHKEP